MIIGQMAALFWVVIALLGGLSAHVLINAMGARI